MSGPIPGPMPGTPEWHALRRYNPDRERAVVFGATSAAAACGLSPYDQPLTIYLKQRGEMEPEEENWDMTFGKIMEPSVLALYVEKKKCFIDVDLPMFFHSEHSFMAATPDAAVGRHKLVDAKTATDYRVSRNPDDPNSYGEEGTDQVPVDVLLQMQQQMAVMDADRVDVPLLVGKQLRIYTVERDLDLIGCIVDAERELAERIINADPPEPQWTHPRNYDLMRRAKGVDESKVVTCSEEVMQWWNEAERLAEKIKEWGIYREQLRSRVMHAMGDAQIGRLPMGNQELVRSQIKDSLWTAAKLAEIKPGDVRRKGHFRLYSRKAKR